MARNFTLSVDLAKLSGTPRNVKGEVTCPGRSNNIRNHFMLLKLTGTSDRMSQLSESCPKHYLDVYTSTPEIFPFRYPIRTETNHIAHVAK